MRGLLELGILLAVSTGLWLNSGGSVANAGTVDLPACIKGTSKHVGNLQSDEEAQRLLGLNTWPADVQVWLWSMMAVESAYVETVVSSAGAVGLLQVTPIAEREVKQRSEIKKCKNSLDSLMEPWYNILMSGCFLMLMLEDAGGNWTAAVAAYHGGNSVVKKLKTNKPINDKTAQYAAKVAFLRRQYCSVGR